MTQLHSDHHGRATPPQRAVNRITAFMARPRFIVLVGLGVAAWMGANAVASRLGLQAVDPPPFPWLEVVATLFSLFVVMLVLVAQKHEDELNAHRDTLTLELAILSEHKIAKVIQLLEELRRDSPMSKTGTIRRRSKWLSLPTPDPFSRLCARTMNSKATRSRGGVRATGTNAGLDLFRWLRVLCAPARAWGN